MTRGTQSPQAGHVYTDFDGTCYFEGSFNSINLAVAEEFRGNHYPIVLFNGKAAVVFPFGKYYLTEEQTKEN